MYSRKGEEVMNKKFFVVVLSLFVFISTAAQSWALSDYEYLTMKNNYPPYARAEKRLTRIWNELKQSMSTSDFQELRKSQLAWIRGGRDEDAEIYMERDYSRAEAYTMATEARAEYLNDILKTYYME